MRMTIGMLIEILTSTKVALGSKLNSIDVKQVFRMDHPDGDPTDGKDDTQECKKYEYSDFKSDDDATPFKKSFSLAKICQEIKSLGYDQFLDTVMTNGQTGEEMDCLIFSGICYYQRLKHMVCDKVHARSRGGKTRMTMQPFEGRRRNGGLRIGHMERDNLLGQGGAHFAKDRLMEQSDKAKFWYCDICGLQAIAVAEKKDAPPRVECQVCQTTKVSLVTIPYATKLVTQEFAAMGVISRISTVPYEEPKT